MFSQVYGIAKIVPDEVVTDSRWSVFSTEELQAIMDGMFDYDSGIPSLETVHSVIRGIATEMRAREKSQR